ncbi:MAG: DEAD/DEAH box helicase [Candidatus Micrarchaeota archaeon]|nr:DEAD/DEAH box helicase [Candidatus Micrarchaeota archaeon]
MPADPYEIFLKKFGSFTDVQKAALAHVEKGENCIITAPTGSGKTEAAVLPLFKRLLNENERKGIRLIYITPLRALNRDLMKRLEVMARELGISISVRHGDTPTKERQLQAASPPEVLITTPETLQNLFLSPRLRSALANVRAVIVDELHELYANKRGAQLAVALERLAELAGGYQRIGISATIGNSKEARRFLCSTGPCSLIDAKGEKEIKVNIEMPHHPGKAYSEFKQKFNLDASTLARIERISDLVKGSESTLIFANTRQVVESLGSKLVYFNRLEQFGGIGVHHSSLDKEERIKVENEFKEGKVKSIIATSSLELGIDIGSINLVIQYGSPRQVTRLVQRVGRGGHRASEVSYGKIIVANNIEALESISIIRQMGMGKIEIPSIEENALDVLANQICAFVLEYKKIELKRMLEIIRRSAPYASVSDSTFEKVLNFLDGERLIRVKDKSAGIGYRSRGYFFSNISVIPDTVRFFVKSTVGNRVISTVDEQFAANYLEEGATFITKGLPWKVVSIEKDTVFVEQSEEFEAAIPDWEGEDIPVSEATAKGVYEIFERGLPQEVDVLGKPTANAVEGFIESQKKYFAPSESKLVIEELEGYAVVHMPLGKRANEFLGKVVAYVASQAAGNRVPVKVTPYALIIDYGGVKRRPSTRKIFETMKNYDLEGIVSSDSFIASTDLFRYKFVQVCKLFGVVEKKATITKSNADRLVSFYKDSAIAEETIRDLKKNYFDLGSALAFIAGLRKGTVHISVLEGAASPLAEEIMRATYNYRELLLPVLPDEASINELEHKINEKKIELLCTYCGMEFGRQVSVQKDETVACPRCKSPMVAMNSDAKASAVKKKIAGKSLDFMESKNYKEALREAGLVEAYGSRAIAALSVYGIGAMTAARTLKQLRKSHRQFLIDLIEAQKNFVRTKKYWR